jgi:hypothetical protein
MQSKLTGLNDKICDVALDLWERYLHSGSHPDYQAYLTHVQNCENCFKDERVITR